MLQNLKPVRCISSKCFEKNLLWTNYSSIFFESSESDRVFKCLHDSNSVLRAAGINSEIFFGRTVSWMCKKLTSVSQFHRFGSYFFGCWFLLLIYRTWYYILLMFKDHSHSTLSHLLDVPPVLSQTSFLVFLLVTCSGPPDCRSS